MSIATVDPYSPKPYSPLILIVDDDRFMRLQLCQVMEQEGYRVVEADDGKQCLAVYANLHPDIVLLDAMMPVVDGFACCHQLQSLAQGQQTPVLMITGLEDSESVDLAFAAGAADFVTKPIHWPVLRQRVRRLIHQAQLQRQLKQSNQQLAALNQQLQCLASSDSLTGLANRRRFDEYLDQEWRRMARESTPLSLILGDVDFFKRYNDTYGHPAGDTCLQQVAGAISRCAKRSSDLAARYGGEEFAIILPNTIAEGAVQVAETLRACVKALAIPHTSADHNQFVTLSLGVASIIPHYDLTVAGLITDADKALYQAKAAGRDRVVLAQLPLETLLPAG
ncbi:PleD family two-component system response regulator [Leptolyngbya sp. FACHB-261]|uniref:response regulator n=1 Tax=Leptolyngbya sp. FACHB-261 TaxID=2692806 RepID=UPI0016860BC8|nr:PleD family two-component system response regulator [Leptolyngbya sp. FACHB-261]MBD2102263.1 PleD family two-component system response regulator [Leptolyngbya sp. FACHB-261]